MPPPAEVVRLAPTSCERPLIATWDQAIGHVLENALEAVDDGVPIHADRVVLGMLRRELGEAQCDLRVAGMSIGLRCTWESRRRGGLDQRPAAGRVAVHLELNVLRRILDDEHVS